MCMSFILQGLEGLNDRNNDDMDDEEIIKANIYYTFTMCHTMWASVIQIHLITKYSSLYIHQA